jgi:hypothetical protein
MQRQERFQLARVKEHVQLYTEHSIQTLVSLMGPKAQIVLFVNKMDLIYPLTDEIKSDIKKALRPLIDKLEVIRGARLHVIFGSAATGLGIVGYDMGSQENKSLFKFVVDHAEKINPALLEQLKHA